METAVTPFNPQSLQDKVRERIQSSFLDLIPDDAWGTLVREEIARFTQPRENSQTGKMSESPLQQLIRAELERRFIEQLREELGTPAYYGYWPSTGGPQRAGEAVKAIIQQSFPEIIEAAMGGIVQQAISILKDNLQKMSTRY